MKRSNTWFASILIVSALLPNVALSASALQNERDNRHHQQQTNEQSQKRPGAQPTLLVPSPAYYAAILGEFRALISEEVAKAEQEHADRKDWNTPAFWISVTLAGIGALYTFFAWRQWIAIRRQGDIAETTLRETSRPWIAPAFAVISGLRFDPDGVRVAVRGVFTNTGSTPAIDARIEMRLILCAESESPIERQRELIEQTAEQWKQDDEVGVTLFPNTPYVDQRGLFVSQAEIDRAATPNRKISPFVVGFVSYRFAFVDSDKLHYTRSLMEIARSDEGRRRDVYVGRNIQPPEIWFSASALGGHQSD